MSNKAQKTIKPCPRCGATAGKGNGGAQCQCKKGKQGTGTPCDAPIKKDGSKSGDKNNNKRSPGDCGCS